MHRNDPQSSPICDDPKKYLQNIHTPKIYSFFWKTPKNIEIQNFEPQKIARGYVCVKISEYPPGMFGLI